MDSKMPNYSLAKWQGIVDAFWDKYKGLRAWQLSNINTVANNKGVLQSITGRIYKFNWGPKGFSEQQICNFPVQGMATADVMPLAMCIIYKQWLRRKMKSLLIGQVHDSIIFDVIGEEMPIINDLCLYVFNRLPQYIEQVYGLEVNVPLTGDIEFGRNYGSLKPYVKGESIVR
jgi:DNA polymerase I-like protein with 3'-5' exonuclease and polymerase domains